MSDFETKTDYLIETKGLLKDRINSLGGSITSGTTFRDYLVWLDSLYEALDEKTITGLPDSLEGKCEQNTTPSKNLFNEIYPNIVNETTKYIHLYVGDGTFTMSSNVPLPPNDPYASLFFITGQATSGASTGGNGVYLNRPITISSTNGYVTVGYRIYGGINPEDYQTQVEKGSSATSWEKYTGPVPNPNNPRPINITTGRQVVSVCGKNHFSDTLRQGAYSFTTGNWFNTTAYVCTTDKIDVVPGQTYTLSFKGNSNNYNGMGFVYFNNNIYKGYSTIGRNIITIPSDVNKIHFNIYNPNGITPSDVYDIQLEKGSTSTTYEEYKGGNYEINLGKQLFVYPYENTTKTQNGITFTDNGDGSITINGTATAQAVFYITGGGWSFNTNQIIEKGTYTFNRIYNNANVYLCTNFYDENNNNTFLSSAYNNATFTISEIKSMNSTRIVVTSGTTVNNLTVYPQLEKGSVATSYSPYKTPIYLGKIGTYQDYIVKTSGKNLFDKDTNDYVQGYYLDNNGVEQISGNWGVYYIPVKPNTAYSISGCQLNGGASFCWFTSNKTFISRIGQKQDRENMVSPNNASYIGLSIVWNSSSSAYDGTTFMLNEGATALPYEPYGEGQWYIHKEIARIDMSSFASFNRAGTWNNQTAFYAVNAINHGYTNYDKVADIYCNRLVSNKPALIVSNSSNTGQIGLGANVNIFFSISGITTSADYVNYFKNNPTILYCRLATPTNTLIEDEELINQLNEIEIFTVISEDFYN